MLSKLVIEWSDCIKGNSGLICGAVRTLAPED